MRVELFSSAGYCYLLVRVDFIYSDCIESYVDF